MMKSTPNCNNYTKATVRTDIEVRCNRLKLVNIEMLQIGFGLYHPRLARATACSAVTSIVSTIQTTWCLSSFRASMSLFHPVWHAYSFSPGFGLSGHESMLPTMSLKT